MRKSVMLKKDCFVLKEWIMKFLFWKAAICLIFFVSNTGYTENIPMKPFSFSINSEKDIKFEPWYKNSSDYVVNFNGFIENEESSGERLYKFDVTFNSGCAIYWGIPVAIPVESQLKSAWTYKFGADCSKEARCAFGFGVNYVPCLYGGVFQGLKRITPGEIKWETREINNIFEHCKIDATSAIKACYDVNTDTISPSISYITIFMEGIRGTRCVLYVKDIIVKGDIPSEADMKNIIAERWEPEKKKFALKLQAWRKHLYDIREQANKESVSTENVKKIRTQFLADINTLSKSLESLEKKGTVQIAEEQKINLKIKSLGSICFKTLDKFFSKNSSYIPFVLNAISDGNVLPNDLYISNCGTTDIELNTTPGEFIPASFLIHALSDINALKPVATDLSDVVTGKTIQSSAIDIKLVKCWYQGGTAWTAVNQQRNKRVMVPELLLNDDKLVKVDKEKKENYLKLSFTDHEQYVCISDPEEKSDTDKIPANKEFPIKDSTILLPVDIPINTNQQFWVTVKVPSDTSPGNYTGKINIFQKDNIIGSFNLKIKIFPFKLSAPYYTSSLYYRGQLSDKYPDGTISSEYKSETQLKAELKNMIEHGVDNPIVYQKFQDKKLLDKYLTVRKEIGMCPEVLYCCYPFECSDTNESKNKLKKTIREVTEFLKNYGISEVYFYGRDEATGEWLTAQKISWNTIREAGGKIFVAGGMENFKKVGDIQDLLIWAGIPVKEEAKKWHSKDHKIWCYGNPQAGVENPAVYRRNYGILIWQCDYDGAATYAYQHSFGNIWNDFDDPKYRDGVFAYPTVNGVIDTIAWEGYREGVNDIRYLTTLINEIEKVKKENIPAKQNIIASAEKYLAELKNTDISELDLDNMRLKIADYIMRLQK